MIDWLSNIDESLFLAINGACPSCDTFMWWVSKPLAWTPLYIGIIYLLWKNIPENKSRLLSILGIVVSVGLADVISARVIKPTAERLRPSHRVDLVEDVHLYKRSDGTMYQGGTYGFVSSHAANHMAVAVFVGCLLSIVLGGKMWLWLLIGWALLIGYSRVHLGVHFPGDVLFGWMLGASIGGVVLQAVRPRLNLETK